MRTLLTFIALEAFAVLLALYQSLGGIRSDEAKYLLNIPYPHPPLARFAINLTEALPYNEMLWRILFATALVQAVWLVARMARNLSAQHRLTLCGFWLFSSAVLFQSGTIYMSVLTALQGLVFVCILYSVPGISYTKYVGWIALFWLASLFTAFQAVLYLPIVVAIFLTDRAHRVRGALAVGVPLILAALFVAGSPLTAASFIAAGGQNAGQSLATLLRMAAGSWLWAGSGVLSILGLIGIVRAGRQEGREKQWALLLSFLLVFVFHITSFRSYYPVLFLPLPVGGVIASPWMLKRSATLLASRILIAVLIFAHTHLTFFQPSSRTVMRILNTLPHGENVLIAGDFGHDWQYESTSPILRYRPALLSKAKAVVCLDACLGVERYGFYRVENVTEEVWARRVLSIKYLVSGMKGQ